jgi:hypothetical protein
MAKFKIGMKWAGFWLLWILLTAGGFVIDRILFRNTFLAPSIVSGLEYWIGTEGAQLLYFELATASILGFVDGLILGLYQWVALRGKIRRSFLWVPATAVGFALGVAGFWGLVTLLVGEGLPPGDPSAWAFELGLLDSAITGVTLAVAQWLILRNQVRFEGLWLPVVVFASLSAWFIRWFFGAGLAFLVHGFVTGTSLTLMLASRKPARKARRVGQPSSSVAPAESR